MLNTTVDDEAPPPQADVAWLHRHGDDAELILRRGLLPDRDVTDINTLTHKACQTCPAWRNWTNDPHPTPVLLELDSTGVIRWVSLNCLEYFGYRRDEVIGRRHTDFTDDGDGSTDTAKQLREQFRRKPAGAVLSPPKPRTMLAKDGRRVPVLWTTIRLADGGMFTVGQLPPHPDPDSDHLVIDITVDGCVTWVSDSVAVLLGFTPGELVGRVLPLATDADMKRHVRRWLATVGTEGGGSQPAPWKVRHATRGHRWMVGTAVRRADGTVRGVLRPMPDDE